MTDFVKIAAAVIVVCISISALREVKKEYAAYLAIICGVLVTLSSVGELTNIKNIIESMVELSDISLSTMKIFFKAVGITVISSMTSDACLDSGNRFLASCVELSGKIAVTVSALPLINSVIKIISEYIGINI